MESTIRTFRPPSKWGHRPTQAPCTFCLLISSLFYLTTFSNVVSAATYCCDPVDGNTATGNGSAANPWGTLESMFNAGLFRTTIQGGDTVKLQSGYHGSIKEYNYDNTDYITIEPQEGHTPEFLLK